MAEQEKGSSEHMIRVVNLDASEAIMVRTRSMSNTSSKAVPVAPVKCTREERQVSSSKAVRGDMGNFDDNNVGGSSVCSGDLVCLEDVMEAEEADDEQAVRSCSCPSHLLPHGDFVGYLYSFNEHGMFRCPHCDKRRSEGKMSDLENLSLIAS